ncbi:TIGR00730 family Rossman fold protein [uncultured Eubacterium sp.]|uniref:LOG family protein n=1 Tax=uncultured Eubacterium sp. TaxID=165185 RepID=UPI003263E9C7
MNITVYLGSSDGNDESFKSEIKELGTWIGTSGNTLVYGGSKTGLMGKLADSVLNAGGKVIGVEPQFLIDAKVQHEGLTKLFITKDMSERRTKMIELGEVFIAFPGGTGTLEEVSEVMCKISMKQLNAPCILYNLDGYYNSLKELLNHMIEKEFSSKQRQEGIFFADNLEAIKQIVNNI